MTYKVELKNVLKKYENRTILKDLNLIFDNSHVYIIFGENGCGKSTLLNILAKYDTNYMGSYDCNGYKIAYLLQDDLLFRNLTVEENLMLQLKALKSNFDYKRINTLASKLGLLDFLNSKVSELSGGEKKKVAIGQIILTDADIILLDEPTANIQKEYAKDLMNVVYEEFRDKILIIASHDNLYQNNDMHFVKIELKDGEAKYGV
ncbi:MAG: ATP-binding cassette domain-containing protein [Peptostreptococcus porci]|nr:ATP-binding cassette domain-containing protein [Peptostreptococcus porci]